MGDNTANQSIGTRAQASTVLNQLKAGTAHLHDRLETRLDLLRPSLSVDDYIALLARFYGYYRPWEELSWPILQAKVPALLEGRRKAELLANDLAHFQIRSDEIRLCPRLPNIETIAQALGSLYVLEGSTLGGQILSRHFAKTLGLQSDGLAFFQGYGPQTGLMWKRFCEALTGFTTAIDEPQVVASAQATFETLTVWIAD